MADAQRLGYECQDIAAAYQERAGDKAEAARLRDLADMTIDESRKKTGKVYRCKHCKLEFQEKPESCPGCNSAAFDEIPKLTE